MFQRIIDLISVFGRFKKLNAKVTAQFFMAGVARNVVGLYHFITGNKGKEKLKETVDEQNDTEVRKRERTKSAPNNKGRRDQGRTKKNSRSYSHVNVVAPGTM